VGKINADSREAPARRASVITALPPSASTMRAGCMPISLVPPTTSNFFPLN
jgi:hypothetical protein